MDWIIDHIQDEQMLNTLGLHLRAIGRFQIKLADGTLSDKQFSIFQKKVFEEEARSVLRRYLPPDRTFLNPTRQTNYGRAVDDLTWEHVQRQVLASESDRANFCIRDGALIQDRISRPQGG